MESRLDTFLADRIRRYRRELATALAYGGLMLFLAVSAHWYELRIAAGALAICRLVAFVAILRHSKRVTSIAGSLERQSRSQLNEFLACDRSFLKSSTYWYALPLSLGLVATSYAFRRHTHAPWIPVLCLLLAIAVLLGSERMNARAIGQTPSLLEE